MAAQSPLNTKGLPLNMMNRLLTFSHMMDVMENQNLIFQVPVPPPIDEVTPRSFRLFRTTCRVISVWKRREKLSITSSTIPLLLPHMRSSMMNFASRGFILLLMVRCNFNSLMTLCFVIFFVVCIINAIFVVQPLKLQDIERILEQTLN